MSEREIEEHIAFITAGLDELGAGNGDLSRCVEIGKRFHILRDRYRQQPAALAGRVQQLAELSRRFDHLLGARLPHVVDRFHEVLDEIRRAEDEKGFWREFLIRRATDTREEHLGGNKAIVRVRALRSRMLPPVGTDNRKKLEALIRESGQWERVSQLSRPKLRRALAKQLFPDSSAGAIEQLCPETVTHQVSSRELGT